MNKIKCIYCNKFIERKFGRFKAIGFVCNRCSDEYKEKWLERWRID